MEKKERAKNIIIHGKEEQEDDSLYVENLTKTITGKTITPVSIERIGRITNTKGRPIKLKFHQVEDKEIIMKNLRNLKGKQEYQGISVRDDFTHDERETIKKYVREARQRSANELEDSRFVWKVFGSPRNNTIVIRRIQKRLSNSLA